MNDLQTRIPRFFAELRRRKVIRVMIAYAVGAYVTTEVSNEVLPLLGIPESVNRLILVILLLGFPVALALAWAFDITPRGIERTADLPTARSEGTSGVDSSQPGTRIVDTAPSPPAGSIAALPFTNLSGDVTQDYLSDGLTEELILALSRVQGLRVAGRTSCFALRRAALDAQEIGRRLNVRHVVDGGVRVAGNRIVLSAQLVDTTTGYVVWTESWERDLGDIFTMQRELARAIVDRVAGDAARATEPARPATLSVEAFKLYLRGRYHWNRRTETDLRRAIEFFEQAIVRDRSYALAWAGLADAYSLLLDYGGMPVSEGLDSAREAAERALRIDPSLAEAYTSLALVRQFEWRWDDAEAAFLRSIALRPEYSVAYQRFSLLLAWLGRGDDAIQQARRAESLDPLAVFVAASTGWVLYYTRRYQDANEQLERALEMDPHFAAARVPLGLAQLQLGDVESAVEHLAQAVTDSGRAASALALHAHALGRAGDHDACREISAELQALARETYVSSYYLALPALALGEHEAALDRLETALERERAAQLAYLGAEPLLDPLRDSPRFQSLLERTGLRRS
jgi:serine/threonine-protein kinase